MAIDYPIAYLIYWKHSNRPTLKEAVTNYFNDLATDDDVPILRDYLKHWVNFSCFQNEGDRLILLGELDQCLTPDDINRITHKLFDFGIDPF